MKPAYEILADEQRVTDLIRDRFLSLRLTDEAGFESDSFELVLDNADLQVAPPETGAELKVSLGYQASGVREMGLFVVDEYERSGFPHQIVIRARSAWGGNGRSKSATLNGVKTALKAQRTRSWESQPLAAIVSVIAVECGLEARVAPELAAEVIAHVDQTDESNAHFLQRLARARDAVFKQAGGFILFVPKAQSKSALGATLPKINLIVAGAASDDGKVTARLSGEADSYRLTVAEREDYQSVTAFYHDVAASERKEVTVGEGEPTRKLRGNFPSAGEAAQAAAAELRRIGRGESAPTFNLEGNPIVAAECRLVVGDELGSDLQGEWVINRAEHTIDESGYRTSIECETPEAS